jgi:hypothetical protein
MADTLSSFATEQAKENEDEQGKLLFLVNASKGIGGYYPLVYFQNPEVSSTDNKLTE